jgi:hypothetical protein
LGTAAVISNSSAVIGDLPMTNPTLGTDDEPAPTTEELIRLSRLRNGRLSRDELGKLRKSLG